jgi:hypothetical protein
MNCNFLARGAGIYNSTPQQISPGPSNLILYNNTSEPVNVNNTNPLIQSSSDIIANFANNSLNILNFPVNLSLPETSLHIGPSDIDSLLDQLIYDINSGSQTQILASNSLFLSGQSSPSYQHIQGVSPSLINTSLTAPILQQTAFDPLTPLFSPLPLTVTSSSPSSTKARFFFWIFSYTYPFFILCPGPKYFVHTPKFLLYNIFNRVILNPQQKDHSVASASTSPRTLSQPNQSRRNRLGRSRARVPQFRRRLRSQYPAPSDP